MDLQFSKVAKKGRTRKNNDYGTILIVMLGCWGSFYFSTYFRSQQFIQIAGEILLPHIFYYVGIAFILVGTTLRAIAVWSLRHSFTLSVKRAAINS